MVSWSCLGTSIMGSNFLEMTKSQGLLPWNTESGIGKLVQCLGEPHALGHGQIGCMASINPWNSIAGLGEVLGHCVTSQWPAATIQNLLWCNVAFWHASWHMIGEHLGHWLASTGCTWRCWNACWLHWCLKPSHWHIKSKTWILNPIWSPILVFGQLHLPIPCQTQNVA